VTAQDQTRPVSSRRRGGFSASMEHIQSIQEAVDEHKDALPTEVVRVVMKEAQELYKAWPGARWNVAFHHMPPWQCRLCGRAGCVASAVGRA